MIFRDCYHGILRAISASLPESPLTGNLVSENADRYLSLTEVMQYLKYRPHDDSAEILDG